MTFDEAIECVNEQLGIDAVQTAKGDELKCWTCDPPGRAKTYLDDAACDRLAEAFALIATALREAK